MYFEYKDYLKQNKFYNPMFESIKNEIDIFMENFKDDSRFLSSWGHDYFCNEDGGRLIYDITKPFEHKCSICGKIYTGFKYNSCYITMLRNEAIVTALKSALVFNIWRDKKYFDITKDIINFYAYNYENFCIHAKDKINSNPTEDVGGAGKIMPQGLNEAIVIIRIINALELIKEDIESQWLDDIKQKLFVPAFDLLYPQKMHIHNIPTWINSAMGVMGLFFNEKKWIDEATQNPFNIFEQLKKGVTESGFWYEGSIHYNFFALEGIMNFFVFAKTYNYEIKVDINKIVFNMFESAYNYAFDNDIFPNPSDGWPNISLKTYSYVYYMAYKVFGKDMLKYIKHIEENNLERARLPLSEPYYYDNKIPLERLLFVPNIDEIESENLDKRISANFEASNCAVLRNEYFNLFFKYGHQTKSHAHPDKMNIEIMVDNNVLTKDLSNSGYGSKLCNKWHRKIASHNTCVVNGMATDIEAQGHLLEYSNKSIKAEVQAYPNVKYTRELILNNNRIDDVFTVEKNDTFTAKTLEKNWIDWFFHFESPIFRNNLNLTAIELFEEYEYILDVYEIGLTGSQLELKNNLVSLNIILEKDVRAFIAKTYNNPADKMRDTIILRKKDTKAVFKNYIVANMSNVSHETLIIDKGNLL